MFSGVHFSSDDDYISLHVMESALVKVCDTLFLHWPPSFSNHVMLTSVYDGCIPQSEGF